MLIGMAVVFSAALCCQDTPGYRRSIADMEEPSPVEGVVIGRLGVWAGRQFHFEATRTDGMVSTSKQEAFFSASTMAGIELYDHFEILGTVEEDVASKITSTLAGAYLGWHDRPRERYGKGVPDEATVYAGAIGGSLKVHESDFGNFDRGYGAAVGLTFGWMLTGHLSADLYGEYRYLKFDYQRPLESGNHAIGGNSGWFGIGISWRF